MKIRSTTLKCLIGTALLTAGTTVFGQIQWTGVAGTLNGTNFGVTTNWSGGSPTSGTLCQFNGNVAGNITAASIDGVDHAGSGNPIGGSFGASGVSIEITPTQTSPVNLISPVAASTGMGFNNITVDSGAAQFTVGNTTANQLLCTLRPSGSVHIWENDSSHPLIIMPNMQIANGGGASGHVIQFNGPGDFGVTNNLRFNNGPTFTETVAMTGTGTLYWTAGGVNNKFNNNMGVVIVNSGTIDALSAGLFPFASGSGVNEISVNGGVLKLDAAGQTDTIARTIDAPNAIVSGPGGNIIGGNVQVNSGTWTFSGPNIYTGSNILTGGELIVGSGENVTNGPLGTNNVITFSGGTLGFSIANTFDYSPRFDTAAGQAYSFDTGSQNVTFTNALTSSGGKLTKLGSGILTISGANTYSGSTIVGAGKLEIQGAQGSGGIVVSNSAVLGVTETGPQITPASLTVGTSSSAFLEFNNVSSTTTAPIAAGSVTIPAGDPIQVNVASGSFLVNNSYPLFSWTSGPAPAVQLVNLTGAVGNLTTNGNSIVLNITGLAFIWTGIGNADWDITQANNWKVNGVAQTFTNGGPVLFDDSASTPNTNIIVNSAVLPQVTTVNSTTHTYSITSSGANNIGGSGGLVKNGNSVLTLSGGVNSFTGPTTISGGTVSVSALANGGVASDIGAADNTAASLILNGGGLRYTGATTSSDHLFTLGTFGGTLDNEGSGQLSLNNGGTLAFSGTGARTLVLAGVDTNGDTLAGVIGDNGGPTAVTKTGGGEWVLTGNNTYSGLTTIANGVLKVGNGGSLGIGNVVNNNGLDFNVSGTVTVSTISGTGFVTNDGPGTVILTGNNTYGGGTTINAGTLQLGNGGATGALNSDVNITNNGTLVYDSTSLFNLNGTLSGSGNVSVLAGTLEAIGLNSYTGWTFIAPGATYQPSRGNSGAGSLASSVMTNNGTLLIQRQDGYPLSAGAPTWGFTNNIVGSGKLITDNNNQNNGAVILAGNNTYTGGTFIAGGGFYLGDNVDIQGSIVGPVYFTNTASGNLNFRVLIFYRPDTFTFTNLVTSVVTDGSSAANSGSLEQDGSGTVILTANNSYPGATTVTAGTMQVGNGGTVGTIGTGGIVDNSILVFDRSDANTYNQGVSGTGGIVQFGTGSLTMTGSNSLSGNITVSNGTMVISTFYNGFSFVTVNDGKHLAVVNEGSGSQAFLNSLTLGNTTGGTTLEFQNVADPLTAVITNASLTINGSSTIQITGISGLTAGNVYPLIGYNNLFSGPLPTLSLPAGLTANLTNDTVNNWIALNVTAVAPPLTAPKIKGISISGGNVIISATNNSGPGGTYHLLGTNNLKAPLATWPVISTGSFGSDGNVSITNATGSTGAEFYILQVP
ncbi:MAG TPA: autotransporter-associated beta strand repeat-containing protein [Verrucomicrobiae bacterium]|nr:autotransporter-associated beta strand repeat-containing protein [Verrucomicrobiae bacterium]